MTTRDNLTARIEVNAELPKAFAGEISDAERRVIDLDRAFQESRQAASELNRELLRAGRSEAEIKLIAAALADVRQEARNAEQAVRGAVRQLNEMRAFPIGQYQRYQPGQQPVGQRRGLLDAATPILGVAGIAAGARSFFGGAAGVSRTAGRFGRFGAPLAVGAGLATLLFSQRDELLQSFLGTDYARQLATDVSEARELDIDPRTLTGGRLVTREFGLTEDAITQLYGQSRNTLTAINTILSARAAGDVSAGSLSPQFRAFERLQRFDPSIRQAVQAGDINAFVSGVQRAGDIGVQRGQISRIEANEIIADFVSTAGRQLLTRAADRGLTFEQFAQQAIGRSIPQTPAEYAAAERRIATETAIQRAGRQAALIPQTAAGGITGNILGIPEQPVNQTFNVTINTTTNDPSTMAAEFNDNVAPMQRRTTGGRR